MVSDLKTFAHNGCKIAAQEKVFFLTNFALLACFFGIGATIRIGRETLCLLYAGFFCFEFIKSKTNCWESPVNVPYFIDT